MYKVADIVKTLEELFPLENAMSYDNPGLLTGSRDAEVKGILLTLDCTSRAISVALEKGCNLIIAHHPLIFGGIDNVCADNVTGKILSSLIKNDIALYACHTQLDCTDEFGNLELAKVLDVEGTKLEGASIGVVYDLFAPVSLWEYANFVSDKLNCSGVSTISSKDKKVKRVFVQGGAFDEENLDVIVSSGVDLVISGEIKHHLMVYLEECGIAAFAAGHNATERIYLPKLKNVLDEKFSSMPIFVDFGNETKLL